MTASPSILATNTIRNLYTTTHNRYCYRNKNRMKHYNHRQCMWEALVSRHWFQHLHWLNFPALYAVSGLFFGFLHHLHEETH